LYSRFTSLDRSDCGTLSRDDFLRIPELAINPLCDRIVHAFFATNANNDDRVNFRQFMQVLAHFRPIKKSKENKLNSREEKLKGEWFVHFIEVCTCQRFCCYSPNFYYTKRRNPNISYSSNILYKFMSKMWELFFFKTSFLFLLSVAFKMYDLDDDDTISRDELINILNMMVGANISQDQLISIAERTILEADQCGQGKISFDDFCKALERTDVEQKMSIRFLN
jgi:calcineurin B homologous protein 1